MVAPSWGGVTEGGGPHGTHRGGVGETGWSCTEARAARGRSPGHTARPPHGPERRGSARGKRARQSGRQHGLAHRRRHKQEETRDAESLSWGQTSLWDAPPHRSWLTRFWLVRSVSWASQKELLLCFKQTQSRKPQAGEAGTVVSPQPQKHPCR